MFVQKKRFEQTISTLLVKVLHKFGISRTLTKVVEIALEQTTNKIRVEDQETDQFEFVSELQQGDPLSIPVFNIFLEQEDLDRHTQNNRKIKLKETESYVHLGARINIKCE